MSVKIMLINLMSVKIMLIDLMSVKIMLNGGDVESMSKWCSTIQT